MDFIKDCLKQMIEPRRGAATPGITVALVADRLGLAVSTVYGWTNDRDLPARLIPAIGKAAESTLLIETICELQGGVYQQLPEGRDIGNLSLPEALAGCAEWAREVGHDIADGKIDALELRRIQKRYREAMQAMADVEAELEAKEKAINDGRAQTLKESG